MRVIYEGLEGCDQAWIQLELRKALAWVAEESVMGIFCRIDSALHAFYGQHSAELQRLLKPVKGFRYQMTNSALVIFPRV